MNYQIEKYKPENKEDILKVWERSVLATHYFLRAGDFADIKAMLDQFDIGQLNVYCLVGNNEVVGFIGLHGKKIEMLFLDPGHIGHGLGKKLMQFAIAHFNASEVDVNEGNERAKIFYELCGFVVYDRTEKDEGGRDYPVLKMRRQK